MKIQHKFSKQKPYQNIHRLFMIAILEKTKACIIYLVHPGLNNMSLKGS